MSEQTTPPIFEDSEGKICILFKKIPQKGKRVSKYGSVIRTIDGRIHDVDYIPTTRKIRISFKNNNKPGPYTYKEDVVIPNASLVEYNAFAEEMHEFKYRHTFVEKL